MYGEKMKNLLLGGAGFIGQHLAIRLLEDGHSVTAIDNLKTSTIDLNNFSKYGNRFIFIEEDLSQINSSYFLSIAEGHDQIYHLAGSVGVENVDKNPRETLYNNIFMATNLTPLFGQLGIPVLFTSTSEVYGEGPFIEDSPAQINANKLRWGYASAKLTSEFMLRACGCPFTIVRLFNVVGIGQSSSIGMVLPRFVEAAKNGSDLIVYGDGKQVRSFCHISDAVSALISVSKIHGELFNIGTDNFLTIEQLAETVINASKSSSKIKYVPYEEAFSNQHADIIKRLPDTTKIKKAIGFLPKYNIEDVIKDML